MAKCYLISEKTIKTNSLVNDNVDSMYLLPAIEFAQDAGLQPIIGTVLYNKLMDMVTDGSITGETAEDYKLLLDEYVTPFLINKVTADIQLPLAYKFRNQGVVQQTGENTYVPALRDIQYLVQNYNDKATFYANRLRDYLHANHNKYPEYCKIDSCADMPANGNTYHTGIYLG